MPIPPLLLAQAGLFTQSDAAQRVPSLPAPPALEHYLLENPWPLVIVLVVAALVAAALLNRRARGRQALLAAGGLLIVAGAVIAAAALVTTTRETLIQRTRELVDATAKADIAALQDMLASDVELRTFFFDRGRPRGELLDDVRRYMGQEYPVQSHREDSAQATIDGRNAARTQVHVVVRAREVTMYDVPVGSWWRIEWRKDDDGQWRVRGLECLQLDVVKQGTRISP